MFQTLTAWLKSPSAKPARAGTPPAKARLGVHRLEDRANPVVIGNPVPGIDYTAPAMTGVVQLSTGCTGTLLATGRHVLTAAHCLTDGAGRVDLASTMVRFQHPTDAARDVWLTVPASGFRVHPAYGGGVTDPDDLAVLELPSVAPAWATRHDLYTGSDEIGQTGVVIGYGRTGNGETGALAGTGGVKMAGRNFVEFDDENRDSLAIDLTDNPSLTHEAIIAPGDSGGPLLINNRVAGVASFVRSGELIGGDPDSDFDDLGVYVRASRFAGWVNGITAEARPLVLDLSTFGFADGAADEWVVRPSGSSVSISRTGGGATVTAPLSSVSAITILGSGDNETFRVSADVGANVTIDGRGGTDAVHASPVNGVTYSGYDIAVRNGTVEYKPKAGGAARTISVVGGVESLTVNGGEAADTVTVTNNGSARPAMTINGKGGGDGFKVFSTGGALTVNGDGGTDTFNVGGFGSPTSLDDLGGQLTVNGGDFGERVTVADDRDLTGNTYTVTAGSVSRGGKTVAYSGVALDLFAGYGSDTITVTRVPAAGSVIDGGGGKDTITVGGSAADLDTLGNGYLTVLAGEGGGDLVLNDRGNPYEDGATSGQYGVSDTAVTRKGLFPLGSSSIVTTEVEVKHGGFNTVTLNAGNRDDLIRVTTTATGPRVTVNAGRGNDVVVGGAGGDTLNGEGDRDILIGGLGADVLRGGAGDDILIGGSYSGAADDARLDGLRTKWTAGTGYSDRVTALRADLAAATVTDDPSTDSLWGEGDMDWFWGVPLTEVKDGAWEFIR